MDRSLINNVGMWNCITRRSKTKAGGDVGMKFKIELWILL
jgi:hypothetical protein